MKRSNIILLIALLGFWNCTPKPVLVKLSDLNNNSALVCNLIHSSGSEKVGSVISEALFGKKASKYVDYVTLYYNSNFLSSLNNKGLPYSQSEIKLVNTNKNVSFIIEGRISDGGLKSKLVGKKSVQLDINPDTLYAFVTEVNVSNETSHIDVYKVTRDIFEELFEYKSLDTFEFTDKFYPKIIQGKKVFSNMNFE